MNRKDQFTAHLEFFTELGIDGFSSDPEWRIRPAEVAEDERVEHSSQLLPAVGGDGGSASGASRDGELRSVDGPSNADALRGTGQSLASKTLDQIRLDLGECTRCELHRERTNLVFGAGNSDAELMFVGEAPGRDEDREGIPFVGRAGQLLTNIIEAIGEQRDNVYIANVIKCRPPKNRNPEPEEVQTCEPFLFSQIDSVKPRIIVALGSFAFRTLLSGDKTPISRARGHVYDFRGAKLIPTFHPAYLLRNPAAKRDVWTDMKLVRSLLAGY